MRRLLTWLYVKLLRDYVLVDMFLTRTTTPSKTLYVVHMYGGKVIATEERETQEVRWN